MRIGRPPDKIRSSKLPTVGRVSGGTGTTLALSAPISSDSIGGEFFSISKTVAISGSSAALAVWVIDRVIPNRFQTRFETPSSATKTFDPPAGPTRPIVVSPQRAQDSKSAVG